MAGLGHQVGRDQPKTLIDLSGFGCSIWERSEQVRAAHIPFVAISPVQSNALQQASHAYGARGVLIKPLVVKECSTSFAAWSKKHVGTRYETYSAVDPAARKPAPAGRVVNAQHEIVIQSPVEVESELGGGSTFWIELSGPNSVAP